MPQHADIRNSLLQMLDDEDLRQVASRLRFEVLPRGTVLQKPGAPTRHLHFLDDGFATVVTDVEGITVDTAFIGFEGMIGDAFLHGVADPRTTTTMQVDGRGWRLAVEDYVFLDGLVPDLRESMLLFSHTLTTQIMHSVLAATRFKVRNRIARCLLMCQDRMTSQTLPITHLSLSEMLGVRRASVTNELQKLEGENLIRSRRAAVVLIDRPGLIDVADGCYGGPETEYMRVFRRRADMLSGAGDVGSVLG